MVRAVLIAFALFGSVAQADTVQECLACHERPDGQIDIVGLAALRGLPEEWVFLYEDAFDLDGDGIAGRMRFVSGQERPLVGIFGSQLSAGRFEDFALIAAGAHDIDLKRADLEAVTSAFVERSPEPEFPNATDLVSFAERGCTRCHVSDTYEYEGRTYMPLSDFLLHDVGEGPVRTTPLWGCKECLKSAGHP